MKCENCNQNVAQYIAVHVDNSNIALCEVCNNNSPNPRLPFEFQRNTIFVDNQPNEDVFEYTSTGEKQRKTLQMRLPVIEGVKFIERSFNHLY